MPKLDGSVGQGAENKRHDIAVVQAALGKARSRDRKPYWPGPIDGDYPRHRKALGQSLAVFQQAQRLRPSGKINRLGSDVDRLESALPAGHRRMSGVPGTTLVRRRLTAAPAPAAEAAARSEATAPLPEFERLALASLQRDLYEAHKLCFTMTGVGVVGGGRFRVSLACPDSEWLDVRRNVFELGGKLPPDLRKGLEGTIARAARAWKPATGNSPGLVLDSTNAYAALRSGAAPKGKDMEALDITQVPGDPTARAALAACIDLILSGEAATPAGRKQFDGLAECVAVKHPQTGASLVNTLQSLEKDLPSSHKQPDPKLLRFYDLPRPTTAIANPAVSEMLAILDGPRPLSTDALQKSQTLLGLLAATDANLGKEVAARLRLLSAPVTEESLKYVRRPTMAEIETFAGPPTLFIGDYDAALSQHDMAEAAGTAIPDPQRREMLELPGQISDMPSPESIVVPEDDPDVLDRLLDCLTEHYGLEVALAAIGSVAVLLGLPIIGKPIPGALGSTDGTSIARELLDKKLGDKEMSKPRRTPVVNPKAKSVLRFGKTIRLATFIGRWIPFIGWIALAADAVIIAQCVHASSRKPMS